MSDRLDSLAVRFLHARERATAANKAKEIADDARKTAEEEFYDYLESGPQGKLSTITLDLGDARDTDGKPYGKMGFQRRRTVTASVLNEEVAVQWLRDHGHEHLTGPGRLRKKGVNKMVKMLGEAGRFGEIPDGLDHHTKRYIQVTRKD